MPHKTPRDILEAVLKDCKIQPDSMTHLVAIYGNEIFIFFALLSTRERNKYRARDLKAHVGRKKGAGGLKLIRKENGCEETRLSVWKIK